MNTEQEEIKILYKYRNWDNNLHRCILIHNKLYLPLISELNDPFDFQLKLSIASVDTKKRVEYLADLMLKSAKKDGVLKIDDENEFEIRRKIRKSIEDNGSLFLENYMSKIKEHYFKYISVLSLSEVWNNILLWTHYSNNHSGFCIGFNKKKLDNLRKLDNLLFFGSHGKIHYSSEYPIIDIIKWNENDLEAMLSESHIKSIDWSYESEYRYIRNWFPDIPTPEGRTAIIEGAFIDEVIIGLNISTDNEKEIREICVKKNIPLYKIQKSDSQFLLERKLV